MATRHSRNRTVTLAVLSLAVALVVSACSPRTNVSGYVPDEELIAKIEPGKQNQNDVRDLLGSPSSLASFEDRTHIWYYISSKTETFAFLAPETTERNVVAVEFDDAGLVKNVRRYTLEDGREVEIVERITPTRGKELSFFEQMFGNFGRFNK